MAKKVDKYIVEVAGERMEFDTLKTLAEALGVDKITKKDIQSGLYDGMGVYIEEVSEDPPPVDTKTEEATKPVPAKPDTVYPAVGSFSEHKALKKAIKKLSDVQLIEWATLSGLTWKPSEHEAINRMRVAMAINELHFPKERKASKSKYSGYTTEQLVAMASEANVEYKPTEDTKILRMRAIMALREAGYIA